MMRLPVFTSRRTIVGLLAFLLGTLFWCQSANAVPSNNRPFSAKQPDGLRIALQLNGDEHRHWLSDQAGFSVVRDKQQRFVYARKQGKKLLPTQFEVAKANPRAVGLKRHEIPEEPNGIGSSGSTIGGNFSAITAVTLNPAPLPGTLRQLVVPIRFSNHAGRALPAQTDFDVLFNLSGGQEVIAPTGSVKDYYSENSYGLLHIESTVHDWFDVTQTEPYCADGRSGNRSKLNEAFVQALTALDADPTFSFQDYDQNQDGFVDSIVFVHSGYGAEFGGSDIDGMFYTDRIWSHHSEMFNWTSSDHKTVKDYAIVSALWWTEQTNITRLGVIVHEMGHLYGIPDLYDTDNPGQGIGSYGVMGNAWGFDYSQYYPPHFSPWSKIRLGWITPVQIDAPGSYQAAQSESNPIVFRIDQGYANSEYLLLENRQPVGFDAAMPQGGLAVWHIDDKIGFDTEGYPGQPGWPENGNHYRIALLQADGLYNLEHGQNRGDATDLYHGGSTAEIGPDTLPNTDSYQFGTIVATGNLVYNIAQPGPTMNFSVSFDGTKPEPFPEPDLAAAETAISGSLGGGYTQTHSQDGGYASIGEEDSLEKSPKQRHDRLEHIWQFNVTPGNRVFNLAAYLVDAGDADDGFVFSWSQTQSGPWNTMLRVVNPVDTGAYQSFDLGTPGSTLYIRTVDTDRTAGQRKKDQLHIDHMYIGERAAPELPPPPASAPTPADQALGTGLNPLLSWQAGAGANSHDIYFGHSASPGPGELQGNQIETTFSPGALVANTIYYWRIDEVNNSGTTTGDTWRFTTGDSNMTTGMRVDSIVLGTASAGRGLKVGKATVSVLDDHNAPVSGAFVTGTFSGSYNETVTGQTVNSGAVDLTTANPVKKGIAYTFCIDEVTTPDLDWDGYVVCQSF